MKFSHVEKISEIFIQSYNENFTNSWQHAWQISNILPMQSSSSSFLACTIVRSTSQPTATASRTVGSEPRREWWGFTALPPLTIASGLEAVIRGAIRSVSAQRISLTVSFGRASPWRRRTPICLILFCVTRTCFKLCLRYHLRIKQLHILHKACVKIAINVRIVRNRNVRQPCWLHGDDMAFRSPYCEVTFSWTYAHRGIVYWEGREALADLKLSMSAVHIVGIFWNRRRITLEP